MKLSDRKVDAKTELLAGLLDIERLMLWSKTKDGQKGINKPISIVDSLNKKEQPKEEITAFDSGKDFMKARKKYIKERRE